MGRCRSSHVGMGSIDGAGSTAPSRRTTATATVAVQRLKSSTIAYLNQIYSYRGLGGDAIGSQ